MGGEAVSKKASEPVQDAMKAYLELAYGLTEASKKKAEKTVKKMAGELLGKGSATAGQLQNMAEDVLATGLANREALARLVRVELDRALGRVGLATSEEVATLTERIHELERELRDVKASSGSAEPAKSSARSLAGAETAAPAKSAVAKKAATKTVAKKAVAKKSPAAKQSPAPRSTPTVKSAAAATESAATATPLPATEPAAQPPLAKKSPAKKSTAEKSTAKQAPAKKAAVKQTTPAKPAGV